MNLETLLVEETPQVKPKKPTAILYIIIDSGCNNFHLETLCSGWLLSGYFWFSKFWLYFQGELWGVGMGMVKDADVVVAVAIQLRAHSKILCHEVVL